MITKTWISYEQVVVLARIVRSGLCREREIWEVELELRISVKIRE